MTTTENATPENGDIIPLDNHATGVEIKPLDSHADGADAGTGAPITTPVPTQGGIAGEELQSMDNHATGPRP
ncbi:hypothetical protein DEJ50_14060 [Streptomyces venezuelae]|uniref:Sigma-like protein n=1 Tax=Streptomyces venezuelae TaxID=54571 RepID=A0A5P2D133_STRVZ|nr:hypothetical protein [Streptomyces venezuelae]QES48776.1 hypothetical protein DEJ50_14060 [Streptomyces venezuelae]